MRAAIIGQDNVVANVEVVADGYVRPGYRVVASETAGPGDIYDPATGLFAVPAAPLADLRAAASASVMALRDARIAGGFTFQGVPYQTRDEDRENIAGAAQLAFMALVAGAKPGDLRWADAARDFAWIAADNGLVTMDAMTVVAFGKAAAAFKQGCIFAAFMLKGAIEKAPDSAALAAIDLDAGWPA